MIYETECSFHPEINKKSQKINETFYADHA